MVDQKTLDWIKKNKAKGYTSKQLLDILVIRGRDPKEIKEALEISSTPGPKPEIKPGPKPEVKPKLKPKPKPKEEKTKSKTNKTPSSRGGILWVLAAILIIALIFLLFITRDLEPTQASEEDFSKGVSMTLNQNQERVFLLDGEQNKIKINKIIGTSVLFSINVYFQDLSLVKGEEKKLDLNNDNFYDLEITLTNIKDGMAIMLLKKINEKVCIESWNCEAWNFCSSQNIQKRKCIDINHCGTVENKPQIIRGCEYSF